MFLCLFVLQDFSETETVSGRSFNFRSPTLSSDDEGELLSPMSPASPSMLRDVDDNDEEMPDGSPAFSPASPDSDTDYDGTPPSFSPNSPRMLARARMLALRTTPVNIPQQEVTARPSCVRRLIFDETDLLENVEVEMVRFIYSKIKKINKLNIIK